MNGHEIKYDSTSINNSMYAFLGDDYSPDQVAVGGRKIFSSPQHEHKNHCLNSSSNNSFGSDSGIANINPFKSRASTSAYEKGTLMGLTDHGKQ